MRFEYNFEEQTFQGFEFSVLAAPSISYNNPGKKFNAITQLSED